MKEEEKKPDERVKKLNITPTRLLILSIFSPFLLFGQTTNTIFDSLKTISLTSQKSFELTILDTIRLKENEFIVKDSYSAIGQKYVYDALHSFQSRKLDGFGGYMNTKINLGLEKIRINGFKSDIKNLYIQIDPYTLSVHWFAVVGPSIDGHSYTNIDSRGSASGGRIAVEKQIPNLHLNHTKLEPILLLEFNADVLQCYDWFGTKLDSCTNFINIQQHFYKYYDPELDLQTPTKQDVTEKPKPVDIMSNVKKTKSKNHKVRQGDTLSEIAKKYKTTVSKIKKINKLKSDFITIGQILKIN